MVLDAVLDSQIAYVNNNFYLYSIYVIFRIFICFIFKMGIYCWIFMSFKRLYLSAKIGGNLEKLYFWDQARSFKK